MTTDARAQGTSFLSLAASDRTPLRALETAAVVGSILVAINQGEAILAGEGVDVLKMGLTYLVPFFVATISAASSKRVYFVATISAASSKRVYAGLLQKARDAERVVYQLIDALPVRISIVDRDQRYLLNNKNYEQRFGLSPEALRGRTIKDVLGDAHYGLIRGHIDEALTGKTVTYEQAVHRDEDGRARDELTTLVPKLGGSGDVEGLYVVVTEITKAKKRDAARPGRTPEG